MFARTKTYTIAEFMAGKHRETVMDVLKRDLQKAVGYAVPVTIAGVTARGALAAPTISQPEIVTAAANPIQGFAQDTILKAFDPLINLIQALAYPIAGVMIAGGCLYIMIGSREKGLDMLRNAAIGYILVQLAPTMLKILIGIGSNI